MRRTRVGAAIVAILLGSAAASVAAASPPADGWRVTALPLRANTAYSFSEPGIATGRHGLLVVNACTANVNLPSTYWRSDDDGRHWSTGFPIGSSAIGCGDSDVALGGDGWQYALTLGAGVSVYRSRDGRTWSGPASFPPPHGEDQPDRPWLVVNPRHPNVVYLFHSEIAGNIVEWTSTDHAATFTGPVPVTGGVNSEAVLTLGSRPLVDPRNPRRMFLFYETASLAGLTSTVGTNAPADFPLSQLWQATTTDSGRHWTNRLVLDVGRTFGSRGGTLGHLLPAVAIDRRGTVYVVVSVRLGSATATHLFLFHSTRSGRWTRPLRVDRGTASNVMPALAVAAPGHLFLAWYASPARDFSSMTARWNELVATTKGGLTHHPRFRITRLNHGGPVHVGGIGNMGAVGFDIRQNWALRDFQSVTVDGCGQPHVTWADDYGKRARTYTATMRKNC